MKRFILTSALLLAALNCQAQTRVNPNQVKWPTGSSGCVYAPGTNTCVANGIPYPSAGMAKSTGSAWSTPSYSDIVALFAGGSCTGYLKNDGTCSSPSGIPYPSAGMAKSTGSAWTTPSYSDIVALFASGSCTGYLKNDGTCSTSGGMVYPSAGIAKSTGSAWTTPAYSDIVALFASGSCSGYLKSDGTCVSSQPAQILTTFVGLPANSQVLLYAPASVAMTVPSSCSGSYMTALVAATASTAILIKDLTTSTTLCTATFAISGTTATFSGTGGSISVGDQIEIIGPSTADATLATIGANIYATR